MSNFTFDEAGSVAKLPKELGENVTSMLGGNKLSTPFSPAEAAVCAHSTGIMQVVQRRHIILFHAGSARLVETLGWPLWRRALQLTQNCTGNGRSAMFLHLSGTT